jgi:tetratricopeptide (TPR) repeat protein
MLDADEHLHLALHAISMRNHHAALTHLHDSLAQRPDDAGTLYLLAVQHAELGLVQRGIDGLGAALALNPGMEMARFQLGLMLLDISRTAEAKRHLEVLASSADAALQLYSKGMIALADSDTALAEQMITQGLLMEPRNPSLVAVMQRLLERLASRGRRVSAEVDETTSGVPVALGAYADRSALR